MSVYMNKYALESGVIQTPDEVGNDLDEIEKVIAGPDGIEAHRDEVEDAMEGVVGDPLEEVAMALYESEYNYNQLMRAIGINELACATSGQEFVLTEASFKGFFDNVKKILKRMFATIANAFRKAILKISSMVSNDKKFAEKHRVDIIKGATSSSWEFKDYYAFHSIEKLMLDHKMNSNADEYEKEAAANVAKLRAGEEVDIQSEDQYKSHVMFKYLGKKVDSIGDLILQLENEYKGEKSDIKGPQPNLGGVVMEALKSDDGKVIKKAYDDIKDTYKKALDAVKKLEDGLGSDVIDDKVANSKAFLVCNRATRIITFEQNMFNSVSIHIADFAKKKRNQARKLALVFINAEKEDTNPNLKHESASYDNPFDAIKLV